VLLKISKDLNWQVLTDPVLWYGLVVPVRLVWYAVITSALSCQNVKKVIKNCAELLLNT